MIDVLRTKRSPAHRSRRVALAGLALAAMAGLPVVRGGADTHAAADESRRGRATRRRRGAQVGRGSPAGRADSAGRRPRGERLGDGPARGRLAGHRHRRQRRGLRGFHAARQPVARHPPASRLGAGSPAVEDHRGPAPVLPPEDGDRAERQEHLDHRLQQRRRARLPRSDGRARAHLPHRGHQRRRHRRQVDGRVRGLQRGHRGRHPRRHHGALER